MQKSEAILSLEEPQECITCVYFASFSIQASWSGQNDVNFCPSILLHCCLPLHQIKPYHMLYSKPRHMLHSNPRHMLYSNSRHMMYSNPRHMLYSNPHHILYSNSHHMLYSNPCHMLFSNPHHMFIQIFVTCYIQTHH